jgi:hypothetical protein
MEKSKIKASEEVVNRTEIQQEINNKVYKLIWKLKDVNKKKEELEKELEATDRELDQVLDSVNNKIDVGWEQGLDMTDLTKEYIKALRKQRDIVHLGLTE